MFFIKTFVNNKLILLFFDTQTMIVIFDLDDTLLPCTGRVPRQTFHMLKFLKRQGCKIGIISYDSMARFLIERTGLGNYIDYAVYGNIDRFEMFQTCQSKLNFSEKEKTFYADDRLDNLEKVASQFKGNLTTFHCKNCYQLFQIKYEIN